MNALVCFAVREEARFFRPPKDCAVLITGMGAACARASVESVLREKSPAMVLSCGFAGGLNPGLPTGTVIFDSDDARISAALEKLGIERGRFHCSSRVATTRAEKAELRRSTSADAVEMESSVIRQLSRAAGIPSATIRVISDAADEDLPVDFNPLMTAEGRIRMSGLLWQIARRPRVIPQLIALGSTTSGAARRLAQCLEDLLGQLR